MEPLTPTETRIHVTVSPAFLEKLEAARLALSHTMPGADAEDILSAGLDLLLACDAKNKALVEKPRTTPATAPESSDPDHVPAAVRRVVWERDGGCCATHNRLAARQKLGQGLMNRYCRDPGKPALPGAATGDAGA